MNNLTPLEVLVGARQLLSDPKKWTKGALARNAKECNLSVDSSSACCFCSIGACLKIQENPNWLGDGSHWERFMDASCREIVGHENIVSYNDNGSTKHEDILKLFDYAIELAKRDEECNP